MASTTNEPDAGRRADAEPTRQTVTARNGMNGVNGLQDGDPDKLATALTREPGRAAAALGRPAPTKCSSGSRQSCSHRAARRELSSCLARDDDA